jgi:hypothetical protein
MSLRWPVACYAYAAAVVVGFAYFLVGIPIQVSDSYGNMVQAAEGTLGTLVHGQFYQRAYLRPFLWANLRIVYDVAGGEYFAWFRGWHVAQVGLLVVLFVRLFRPRDAAGAVALPIGLAALIGLHTFAGTVREAFPINTFLTIVLCCFAAADLAMAEQRWWRNVAAAMLLAFAALTVESGLLVAVVFVSAYLAGARGVSRVGIAGIVAVVAGYFYLRFIVLNVGAPTLEERSSGFGFSSRDPEELIRMFGGNAIPFYLYNVTASLLSVVFSEPRAGVWAVTRGFVAGEPEFAGVVNVIASATATALIVAYGWRRRREWFSCQLDRDGQIVVVFCAVALASSVLSYAYTKDVILSSAGALFALALAVVVRDLVRRVPAMVTVRSVAVAGVLLLLSTTWAIRAVGIHLALRASGDQIRNEWAYVDQALARDGNQPVTQRAIALKQQLQQDAILRHPSRPPLAGRWVSWFEE